LGYIKYVGEFCGFLTVQILRYIKKNSIAQNV
jgi:hypothetical protein